MNMNTKLYTQTRKEKKVLKAKWIYKLSTDFDKIVNFLSIVTKEINKSIGVYVSGVWDKTSIKDANYTIKFTSKGSDIAAVKIQAWKSDTSKKVDHLVVTLAWNKPAEQEFVNFLSNKLEELMKKLNPSVERIGIIPDGYDHGANWILHPFDAA